MRNHISLVVLALLVGCASVGDPIEMLRRERARREGPPPPPTEPLPITAFAVRFTPVGGETYPPTTSAAETRAYKVVLHLGSQPPQVRREEKPTRPYVTIGTLRFGENWYTGRNLDDLIEKHVPAVGGNAVLTWTIYQTAVAAFPSVGQLYYATYEAEVIRYTDR